MQAVLIEDDPDTHAIVIPMLESQGFHVWSVFTGVEGLELVNKVDPDILLLDVNLPDMRGWEVCERIRAVSDLPIMMISADATDDEDLVHALQIGADDYLLKPLRAQIFLARIHALVRRSTRSTWGEAHAAYLDNYLTIDLYRQQVRVKGAVIAISYLEYQLLELLVRNMNQTVPTSEVIENLWPGEGEVERKVRDHSAYVRIYVNRLRGMIEPNPRKPIYITNERGLGYRFNSRT